MPKINAPAQVATGGCADRSKCCTCTSRETEPTIELQPNALTWPESCREPATSRVSQLDETHLRKTCTCSGGGCNCRAAWAAAASGAPPEDRARVVEVEQRNESSRAEPRHKHQSTSRRNRVLDVRLSESPVQVRVRALLVSCNTQNSFVCVPRLAASLRERVAFVAKESQPGKCLCVCVCQPLKGSGRATDLASEKVSLSLSLLACQLVLRAKRENWRRRRRRQGNGMSQSSELLAKTTRVY